jgi:hypothetical protein
MCVFSALARELNEPSRADSMARSLNELSQLVSLTRQLELGRAELARYSALAKTLEFTPNSALFRKQSWWSLNCLATKSWSKVAKCWCQCTTLSHSSHINF